MPRPALLFIVCLCAALAGCTAGTVTQPTAPEGYIPDAAGRTAGIDWRQAEAVTVRMDEYDYVPANLVFKVGRPYRVRIENMGAKAHTFSSEPFFKAIAVNRLTTATGIIDAPYIRDLEIPAGQSADLQFIAVTPGTHELVCNEPLHEIFGMSGSIRIE
jgi:plastocyanin